MTGKPEVIPQTRFAPFRFDHPGVVAWRIEGDFSSSGFDSRAGRHFHSKQNKLQPFRIAAVSILAANLLDILITQYIMRSSWVAGGPDKRCFESLLEPFEAVFLFFLSRLAW